MHDGNGERDLFALLRYWGGDDSKPKHCLTLEALHALALQRSKERAGAKKKRLSNGHARVCSEEDSLDKTELPSSKRLKRSAGREVQEFAEVSTTKKALQKVGGNVRRTSSSGVVLDDKVFGGEREMEEEEEEDEEMSGVDLERLSEAENGESERDASPSADEEATPTLDQKTAKSAKTEDEATPTLQPLGRDRPSGGGGGAGRKVVHRKLPDWIQNFHVIENDIQRHSQ